MWWSSSIMVSRMHLLIRLLLSNHTNNTNSTGKSSTRTGVLGVDAAAKRLVRAVVIHTELQQVPGPLARQRPVVVA